MRDQETAVRDAREHATELIDALQDADAPGDVIADAEALYAQVQVSAIEGLVVTVSSANVV